MQLRQDPDTGVWSAQRTAYNYVLEIEDGSELLAYQLHPHGPSGFWAPHVHVGRLADPAGRLGDAHLPTGEAVDLDANLVMALDDLGVRPTLKLEPRRGRNDISIDRHEPAWCRFWRQLTRVPLVVVQAVAGSRPVAHP